MYTGDEMKNKTCCFTGHRIISKPIKHELKEKLKLEIEKLITLGYTDFCNGGAIGFDTIACEVVLALKKSYPSIKLIMILPCKNQDNKWNSGDKEKYQEILTQADEINYISERYVAGCMQARNLQLIEQSSICLCYLKNNYSGTAFTVRNAKENELTIINLADNM